MKLIHVKGTNTTFLSKQKTPVVLIPNIASFASKQWLILHTKDTDIYSLYPFKG